MTAAVPSERRCEACGASLQCGAGTGSCWCATVEVAPAVLAELRRRYEGCLCPACLRAAAANGVGVE